MANEADMGSWTDLLHSSTKLLEQAGPSAQFPPLQRNLDQLEALSKKLKAKTLRTEAPSQAVAATRFLAREGINAEQLARDLKSFELKTTYEDVFPTKATTVEEYLQQIILLVGTKLQLIITNLGLKIQESGNVVKGNPVVHPDDGLF